MPRVHHRKAGKDYPHDGIKKGDMYFTWRIKMTYGGRTYRSLTQPKPSQLTQSPYKSGFLAAWEAWDDGDKTAEDISSLEEAMQDLANEAQESYDNLPENFQYGATGELLENRVSELEQLVSDLSDHASDMQSLEDEADCLDEERNGLDEDSEDDDEQEEIDRLDNDRADKEQEITDLREEIDGLNNMPE